MPESKPANSTITETKADSAEINVTPSANAATATTPMETRFELNSAGRWEKKLVPVGVIGAGDILEELEKTPSDSFDTGGYDQDYSYYFASQDLNHPSTQRALAGGYAPHSGKPMRGHHLKTLPGWGPDPVIVCGDTVVVAVPRRLAERREEIDRDNVARYEASKAQSIREKGEQILDSAGLSYDKNSFVSEARHEQRTELFGMSDADRATLMAESFARAAAFARDQDNKARANIYGGFRGNPEYNKAVPDSRLNIADR